MRARGERPRAAPIAGEVRCTHGTPLPRNNREKELQFCRRIVPRRCGDNSAEYYTVELEMSGRACAVQQQRSRDAQWW